MRYRPFGISGKAVSALSLVLRETPDLPRPEDWRDLLFTAFENGINCFEIVDSGPVLTAGLAAALPSVERGLLFQSWRIVGDPQKPLTADRLGQILRDTLKGTGAGYFDLLTLDETAFESLTKDGRVLLGDIHSAGLAPQIGLCGEGPAVEQAIADPVFKAVAMPFSLISDGRVRRRVKDAAAADMVTIAYEPLPAEFLQPEPTPAAKPSLFERRRSPLSGAGTYAFLRHTSGWTPEELCISYALTEPAFATVQVEATGALNIERMASVPDRELPTSVPAQIEMARFTVDRRAEQRRA